MRIGIHPILKREAGGIYQYTVTMLDALDVLARGDHQSAETGDEWVLFAHEPGDPILQRWRNDVWTIQPFRPPGSGGGAPAPNHPDPDQPGSQPDLRAWIESCGVELMVYPAPHRLSFESGIPYVLAIHDLQHRLQPEFPEVSADGEWNRREYLFRNAARGATLLIAESEVGREDILRFYGEYGAHSERVKVLPYLPPRIDSSGDGNSVLFRRDQFNLPERFFFYPAQFWPHKNHLRIVQALEFLLKAHGLRIPIVFTGSSSGELRARTFAQMLETADSLGVREQVLTLGYVADEEVAALYGLATALIMPTFFGPTNIPILEAWTRRCPVLTSDIRGVRDQAGDAAVLVDPANVASIADGMHRLWNDGNLRRDLTVRGERRVSMYTTEDYRRRLGEIMAEAKERVAVKPAAAVGV